MIELISDQWCLSVSVYVRECVCARAYLGPDKDENVAQLGGRRLQQLEHVRKDADRQRLIDRPRALVEELGQQHQRAVPVRLREQHLCVCGRTAQIDP